MSLSERFYEIYKIMYYNVSIKYPSLSLKMLKAQKLADGGEYDVETLNKKAKEILDSMELIEEAKRGNFSKNAAEKSWEIMRETVKDIIFLTKRHNDW